MAQFELSVMLLVPSAYIATDIRTGFPNLISKERTMINQLIFSRFKQYNESLSSNAVRPLLYADNFLQIVEEDLYSYFNQHLDIEVISCNVNIFTETELIPLNSQIDSHKNR
ncbi:hypothetical protein ACF3NG_05985 [Aerococcaceae bacterium WGS1372]